MIFDAGAFLAYERGDDRIDAIMKSLRRRGITPTTNEAALAQVWRDPAKQVPLTMLLRGFDVKPFGSAQAIGALCAASKTNDVVDASLAVLSAETGAAVLTTDAGDMRQLGASHVSL